MRNQCFVFSQLHCSCCCLPWTAGFRDSLFGVKQKNCGLTAVTGIVDFYVVDVSLEGGENSGKGLRAEVFLFSSQYSIVFGFTIQKGNLALYYITFRNFQKIFSLP